MDNIQEEVTVWFLRARITIEHLEREFMKASLQPSDELHNTTNKVQDGEVLKHFLQEVCYVISKTDTVDNICITYHTQLVLK